jgi:hypothetical protein
MPLLWCVPCIILVFDTQLYCCVGVAPETNMRLLKPYQSCFVARLVNSVKLDDANYCKRMTMCFVFFPLSHYPFPPQEPGLNRSILQLPQSLENDIADGPRDQGPVEPSCKF